MAELVIADFSGGLNLTASPDKVPDRELLIADNCRFDELGNVSAAGATTKQNSSAYTESSRTAINSLYFNPTLRHVAGVGHDVFAGSALSGLSSLLDEVNTGQAKMTFTEQKQKVIYETAGTPRFIESGAAHVIDWPAPTGSASDTGPNSAGAGANVDRGAGYPAWSNPANVVTSNDTRAIAQLTGTAKYSDYLNATGFAFALGGTVQILGIKVEVEYRATNISQLESLRLFAQLLQAGNPVGDSKFDTSLPLADAYATLGSTSDLWGGTWTATDINSATFGVQLYAQGVFTGFSGPYTVDVEIDHVRITVTTQGGPFTVALGGAGNPNGTYTYKATFVDADAVESGASEASASIAPASQIVNLSAVGTGDSKTTKRYIYRKGGTLTFYYRIGEIADNATTTFADNKSDATVLADGILLAGEAEGDEPNTRIGASANVKYPEIHYDRLFWVNQATGSQNQILWSKTLHPFAYPAVNSAPVGDGKPITRLVVFLDDLIIFKTDSIWRLSGSDENTFVLTRTPATVGCDMPFTVVKMQDRIMFTNTYGIWFFDGVTARKATNRLDLFFYDQTRNGIAPITANATTNNLHEATVADNVYYLSYSDSGSTNNRILAVDLEGATIRRYNIAAPSITSDPVTGTVYIGDAAGFIRQLDDPAATNDAGSALTWTMQTKYFEPQRGSDKKVDGLELDIDTSGQNITPTMYFDSGAASTTLSMVNTTLRDKVALAIPAGNSRKARNFSLRLSGSLTTVNESNAPAVTLYGAKVYYDPLKQRTRTS